MGRSIAGVAGKAAIPRPGSKQSIRRRDCTIQIVRADPTFQSRVAWSQNAVRGKGEMIVLGGNISKTTCGRNIIELEIASALVLSQNQADKTDRYASNVAHRVYQRLTSREKVVVDQSQVCK